MPESIGPTYDIAKRDLEDDQLYRLNRKFQLLYDQLSQLQARLALLEKPIPGWSRPSGVVSRATFDESTVTLPELARRAAALLEDLLDGGILR